MKRIRTLTLGASLLALCPAGVWAGDGVVALQTAEASCRDDSTAIYVDCGNGTVTDNRTGLVWLADADCLGAGVDWYTAMEFVAGLADMRAGSAAAADDCDLSDGSSPGEWRLPSVAEWEAMVADADGGAGELDCNPTITSDLGTLCWSTFCAFGGNCSFSGVQSLSYWSFSTNVFDPMGAWQVFLANGNMGLEIKSNNLRVWPVRGGQ